MSYKILLADNVDERCEKVFSDRGIEAVRKTSLTDEELYEEIGDYHGIVVRSSTKITPELLKHANNLKVIGRAGVGVDNIDIPAATKRGVLVMNTPDGNTISTAEHTCGMILAIARNIPQSVDKVKNGGWDRKKYMGTEVHSKVLGIVGLGKIGGEVAKRMQEFGMTVKAYDPFASHEKAQSIGVELLELDELLGEADFLTVHTPLTEKTKGLVSKGKADIMKKGMFLVNCARGGIYKEEDLPELLDSGVLAGVALDVYSQEPPSDDLYEILKHPKIISTPHLGASTEEAQEKVAEQIAYQMADALEEKSFKGSLNGKSISLITNREVQPYLELAEKLGKMAIQVAPEHTSSFSFEYSGECAKYADVLTDSMLKGMLAEHVSEAINLINARHYAEERGFKIKETTGAETKTFTELITVKFDGDAEYKEISATVFGDGDYRIVKIDGFGIELRLEGDILMYTNIDKPGMLAAVSGALAKQDINIASLSLGRTQKGSQAITAVAVDKQLTDDELKPIVGLDGVGGLRYISLS
ncbi:phosphoglycerate dehydrogenase [Aliifodinibius sp. S!AR15-10]|uniref:phosphoglycerate dehydrogenase n=1 Tax=Aliifodinibius sp. S!AR15-10 TaxID=2950437 RepID=UPI00285EA389|nr:phosphoglycerate dehydrogenase [Aliifodinibius sp. S!AR15-10]MDR8389707.1 phosphoglycerate dehydrogenase [Aliifodinibius sp. S!AR15-10]